MPTWGEILSELNRSRISGGNAPDYDKVRRKYLSRLSRLTGRPTILYASAYLDDKNSPPETLQISLRDMQGFMEAVSNIDGPDLDIIVHSPGGSAEAAESIVSYLRKRFDHVRAIVPLAAMSAATMIVLSADEIVMGQHSQLGPIDPQFSIMTPEGPRSAPAKAILKQFDRAKNECRNPQNIAAWMPILRGYLPGLLTQCEDSQMLAEQLVGQWLRDYMFAGESDADAKASRVATYFADYDEFLSHARPVDFQKARELGLKVSALEEEHKLQDAVLSVHHATMHTFSGTPSLKIIENHLGRTWATLGGQLTVTPVPPPTPTQQSRPQRRQRRR